MRLVPSYQPVEGGSSSSSSSSEPTNLERLLDNLRMIDYQRGSTSKWKAEAADGLGLEVMQATTSSSSWAEDDEERDCFTPTGVDVLPLYERAQVVLLTFSRNHAAFGRALINEDLPELAERRVALTITVLGSGAKVLVFSEHFAR